MKNIEEKKYGNGLKLYMEKRPNTKKVAMLIGVKVGSVDENNKLSGGSHFNEHLLFKSNQYRTTRKIVEDLEYTGTVVNAYTTWKYTAFYAKAPHREIENAIQVLYEAATNHDYNTEEFELERQVILTEIQNYINSPEKYSLLGLFIPTLFRNTPLERKIDGTVESMGKVKKEDLEDFKKKYYVPNNMVISVCGKFNDKSLKEKVGETFGSMDKGRIYDRGEIEIINRKHYMEESREDINQMYMGLGYKVPGYQSSDYFRLKLLCSILSGGLSSRMFYELREKRGIGYSVGSKYHPFGLGGMLINHVDGFDPKKLEETRETILKIFEDLKNKEISGKEFNGAKKLMLSKYDDRLEDISDRAILMLEHELYNIPFDFRKKSKYINKIKRQDLMDTAKEYLDDGYTLTILKPE